MVNYVQEQPQGYMNTAMTHFLQAIYFAAP